jgi:hypothetical protein
MKFLEVELLRAAKACDVNLKQLKPEEEVVFWKKLTSKFSLHLDGQIWCQINFSINKFDPEGWRNLADTFDDWPNYIFCDYYHSTTIFVVNSKPDLLKLLGESFHFVVYLATHDLTQLAVFDDHDCLRVTTT